MRGSGICLLPLGAAYDLGGGFSCGRTRAAAAAGGGAAAAAAGASGAAAADIASLRALVYSCCGAYTSPYNLRTIQQNASAGRCRQ